MEGRLRQMSGGGGSGGFVEGRGNGDTGRWTSLFLWRQGCQN